MGLTAEEKLKIRRLAVFGLVALVCALTAVAFIRRREIALAYYAYRLRKAETDAERKEMLRKLLLAQEARIDRWWERDEYLDNMLYMKISTVTPHLRPDERWLLAMIEVEAVRYEYLIFSPCGVYRDRLPTVENEFNYVKERKLFPDHSHQLDWRRETMDGNCYRMLMTLSGGRMVPLFSRQWADRSSKLLPDTVARVNLDFEYKIKLRDEDRDMQAEISIEGEDIFFEYDTDGSLRRSWRRPVDEYWRYNQVYDIFELDEERTAHRGYFCPHDTAAQRLVLPLAGN